MFNTAAALRLFQRDSARLPAMSSTAGGLQLPAGRGDTDDGWRAALVDSLNRKYGLRRTWPAPAGPHRSCTPGDRFAFRGGV